MRNDNIILKFRSIITYELVFELYFCDNLNSNRIIISSQNIYIKKISNL